MKFLKSLLALTLISGFSAQAMRAPVRPTVRSTPRAATVSAARIMAPRFIQPAAMPVEHPRLASYVALSAYSRMPIQASSVMVPTRHFSSTKSAGFFNSAFNYMRAKINPTPEDLLKRAVQEDNYDAIENILKKTIIKEGPGLTRIGIDYGTVYKAILSDVKEFSEDKKEKLVQILVKFFLEIDPYNLKYVLNHLIRSENFTGVKAYVNALSTIKDCPQFNGKDIIYLIECLEHRNEVVQADELKKLIEHLKKLQFKREFYKICRKTPTGVATAHSFSASNYEEYQKGIKFASADYEKIVNEYSRIK